MLGFLLVTPSSAVVAAQDDEERRRAFQLYKDAKHTEALPLFEKLAVTYPNDPDVIETFGLLVMTQTVYLKEAAARKQARLRGREILLRAQKLGADSPLLKAMLERPIDGDDSVFSTKKEVDDAMREGEGAFAGGNYTKAIEMYQRALLLDPTLYEAALFTGDVYFKTADQVKAGEWFARAIAINPDRETAYRYWGDALIKQGRVTEAGDKFVEAFIAEPYSRFARTGFLNWAEKVHVTLAHPKVELPANVTPKQEGGTTITLDSGMFKKDDKSGSGGAWMLYGIIRASWSQSEFKKQYPNETKYRHSLKEEAAALRGALKVLDEQKGADAKSIDPSLQILRKLEKEGLLEAFILLALPDDGIVQDFAAYRKTNTENLRRYVKQYVLNGGGQ
ncbi:MAG TPA: tetratricopeptide repeat protein [Pyrinomonadaceae bacterium]|nr:tetratricopeptide repeat protein [Pyrinomonadaceae bacterium]